MSEGSQSLGQARVFSTSAILHDTTSVSPTTASAMQHHKVNKTTNFERKEFLSDARIPVMYFKPHEDPAFQNLVSYLPQELQHSQPKKAAVSIGGVMGPPMYTVSGQIAQANRVAEPVNVSDVDDAFDTTENGNSENVTENIVVKRTRSATNGDVPEAKKTRV